jgi:hypothetical protein
MPDVMERLSAANPVPECSPLSIDEVWRRLEETSTTDEPPAKGTTAGADRWRRGRRPDLALVAVGLSVLVVVAMFLGALALLHDRGATRETSPAASSQQELLLRTLGVLRTAPTATDRALATCIERSVRLQRCLQAAPPEVPIAEHPARFHAPPPPSEFMASLGYPRFDLALIRSVPMPGSAEHVTIFPASFRSSRRSAPRTWGVVVNLVDSNNNLEVLDLDPTSAGALRAHGIAVLPSEFGPGYPGRPAGFTVHDGAIIVPDGVAKVTVGTVINRPDSNGPGLRVLENVTAAVHDNVATVPLRTPTFNTGFGFGPGAVLRVTWLDAHGKVIRHTTTTFPLADNGPASP